ncbi:MAG: sigma-70 family RNA polymerase sigma factor [Clostridia bacterium]|nr:sigma-70 family RNA polymerase sigma factor [Clostridia bacterium]
MAFDLSFLGLTGSIDEEVAQAIFSGKGDITRLPSNEQKSSGLPYGATVYPRAQKILKTEWDKEMRRQGINAFSGDYTKDHPPTLLKNKNAEVVAALAAELSPEIRSIFEDLPTEKTAAPEETDDTPADPLLDLLFENYFRSVITGINGALDVKAAGLGVTADELPLDEYVAALDGWADGMLAQELPVMTTGQKAKEIFHLSRSIPQETDFSNRADNRAKIDAERKLFHTRANVSVVLFQDDISDPALREEALKKVSLEELTAASVYVDDFLKSLNDTDRRITELLLQKFTQQEIADKIGVGQATVSKRIKKIQQAIIRFDPEVKKILPLFGKK